MEVTTEITTADYRSFLIDYYFYQNKITFWFKLIVGGVAMAFVLFLFINNWFGWTLFLLVIAISLILLYSIFVMAPFAIKMLKFSSSITHLLFLNRKLNITPYAPGISVENDSGNNFFNWEQINRIVASSKYICIYLTDKKILLIPKVNFENSESARLFLYKIENGWHNTKPASRPFQELGSPSYLWGLIGLGSGYWCL